jgi:hypothetical protein
MNELNVNLQHSILTLAGNGWSNRRIARELGINRETVGKYLLLARPEPAISTPGSEPDPNSKQIKTFCATGEGGVTQKVLICFDSTPTGWF